jgi:hypothetical protein
MPRWQPDGTQPPPPPQVWEDSTAGLVTGDSYREEQAITVNVVTPDIPGMLDLDEVRAAVDAALGDEEPDVVPGPARGAAPPPPAILPSTGTPGLVPANPRAGWPRSPAVRQLAGLRRPAERIPPPAWTPRKKPGAAAGVAVGVIVMIGILIWIVVSIIVGILDTISGIVN